MVGTIPDSLLTTARIAFSTPFVNMYSHPLVAGPVLASHPLDLQDFHETDNVLPAPTGAPSINIEAKLVDVNDDAIENGGNPEGMLIVRGPSVGKVLGTDDYVDVPHGSDGGDDDSWVPLGVKGVVLTNGTFRLYEVSPKA